MTAQITLQLDPTTDTTGNAELLARMIDQAVQDALAKAGNDIKLRELELKEKMAHC